MWYCSDDTNLKQTHTKAYHLSLLCNCYVMVMAALRLATALGEKDIRLPLTFKPMSFQFKRQSGEKYHATLSIMSNGQVPTINPER